jgi:hypothetical protein
MISWLLLVLRVLTGIARSRASLAAENGVLRHQLSVLCGSAGGRCSDHPEGGEDRIALELRAKLGAEHAPSTIRRCVMARKGDGCPFSSTWRTFLAGHAAELWTRDLSTQPLWNYSVR